MTFTAVGIHKRYGAVTALAGVDLSVTAGEVHGLLGENGAGKTTLIRIAAGLAQADGGHLELAGTPYAPGSPAGALAAGVRVVGQEFALAPNISVAENLCLGSARFLASCPRGPFGRAFPWRRAIRWAGEHLDRTGVPVDPRRRVSELTVSERQLVALARGVLDDPRVVFLDEPSSALDQAGVRVLEHIVHNLHASGVAVVYVSHKMEEIFTLTDRFTVLRDGRTVAAGVPTASTTADRAIAMMVGREIDRLFPQRPEPADQPVTLEVADLHAPGVHGVDLVVRRGEIVGIGGLVGAGRTELARAITGLARVKAGEIRLHGAPVRWRDRKHALSRGVEYVTEDRIGEGLVPLRSIDENVTARILGRFELGPFVLRGRTRAFTAEQIRRFRIAAPDPSVPVGRLSGGNQQKALLAACVAADPSVIFFDEPTRGIDVGAKAEIYGIIRALAEDRAVVVISAELIELLGLADRILIMRAGRIAAEFAAADATEELLVSAAVGG